MSWEKNITKYGFETKNREEIFKKFNSHELNMPAMAKLNQEEILSGEDYDECWRLILEKSRNRGDI